MKIKFSLILCLFGLPTAVAGVTNLKDTAATTATTAKVFGGRAQYATWTVGLNAGILSPFLAIGGTNNFNSPDLQLGYGINIRKQLAHSFALQADIISGHVAGSANPAIKVIPSLPSNLTSFKTTLVFASSLTAQVNVATVDFLKRKNAINFFVSAGAGYAMYNPTIKFANGQVLNNKDYHGSGKDDEYLYQYYVPVGAGVRFKLNEQFALNFGYTMHFLDGDYFDGVNSSTTGTDTYKLHKDKFSYGYGGIEYTFGTKSKPNLQWANPVAMMYDELNDPKLRNDVEALKGRVTNVEGSVESLKKDSDNDGVQDQFDKCPNTPANTVVDGSGCPIKFP